MTIRPPAPGVLDVRSARTTLGSGERITWSVTNRSTEPVGLDRVSLEVCQPTTLILEHGYQSWSVVRRVPLSATGPDPKEGLRPERAETRPWARACHVSDPDGAGTAVVGDHFLVHDGGVAGFLDGRCHLGVITSDGWAEALLDGVVLAPGETRPLDPMWVAEGDPGPLYSEYAALWGNEMKARATTPAPLGWCSWYQFFAGVTPAHVDANLHLAAEHGIEVFQIDDGYQAHVGDWLDLWPTWMEGGVTSMSDVATRIAAAGMRPGIWTAPFLVGADSLLYAEHPDWVARDDQDRPLRAMFNPNNWGGWTFALDTTKPEVLDHLRRTFRALRAQGWTYHKIDFCYAATIPGVRAGDAIMTRAQGLRAGLEAVREGIGNDAFLLGCGCPFGPAVGIVDAMRVSADVAPIWDPAHHWPGFVESAPAAINAIQASVLRAPLHRRLWANDPDCLLLRATDTGLDSSQRALLAATIAGTGGFTIISDDLAAYGDDDWAALAAAAKTGHEADGPLTIDDPFATPVVVRSARHTLTIDWEAGTGSLRS